MNIPTRARAAVLLVAVVLPVVAGLAGPASAHLIGALPTARIVALWPVFMVVAGIGGLVVLRTRRRAA